MTAPYLARAEADVTRGVTLTSTVTLIDGVDEYVLDASQWVLRLDEKIAPHARLDVTCAIPSSELLDLIDPRQEQYLRVDAGYLYHDGVEDVHEYAYLRLSSRTIRRNTVASQLELTALGREQDVVERQTPVDTGWVMYIESLDSVYQIDSFLYGGTFETEVPYGTIAPSEYPLGLNPTDILDDLGYARAIADSLGAIVYCDQLGVWQLRYAPTLGTAAAILSTGPGGTIVALEDTLSRDDWANIVYSSYENDDTLWSSDSDVDAGETPKMHHEKRKNSPVGADPTPEGEVVDSANAGLLTRLKDRGAELTVDTVAHLWLRCFDTVTVSTPDREQQRVLIAAITTTSEGLQTIRTRKPN